MSKTKRDLSRTAYCLICFQYAEYERGIGSPLSIKHEPGCPHA